MTVLDQLAVDRAVLVPPTVCPTFHTFCKTIGKGEPPFDGGETVGFSRGVEFLSEAKTEGALPPENRFARILR